MVSNLSRLMLSLCSFGQCHKGQYQLSNGYIGTINPGYDQITNYKIMGNFRDKPERTKHFDHYDNHRFDVVATGMCGWRKYMEDAHICNIDLGDGNSFFAVFDGHGGPEVSDQVHRIFVQFLKKNPNYISKNYEQALIDTFVDIDKWLMSKEGEAQVALRKQQNQKRENASNEEQSDAGCTAVACLVTNNQVFVANAGDSRCFLASGGKAIAMSEDHKPDNELQIQRIKEAGGQVIEGRVNGNLNLSRALGDFQYKKDTKLPFDKQLIISRPDVMIKPLEGVQYIVLGCDGLFEVNSNQQILDIILKDKTKSLEGIVTDLLDGLVAPDTQGHYGLDNMTMILAKLK